MSANIYVVNITKLPVLADFSALTIAIILLQTSQIALLLVFDMRKTHNNTVSKNNFSPEGGGERKARAGKSNDVKRRALNQK
jgi:hypothetical protein